jgi:hypothetical protein
MEFYANLKVCWLSKEKIIASLKLKKLRPVPDVL